MPAQILNIAAHKKQAILILFHGKQKKFYTNTFFPKCFRIPCLACGIRILNSNENAALFYCVSQELCMDSFCRQRKNEKARGIKREKIVFLQQKNNTETCGDGRKPKSIDRIIFFFVLESPVLIFSNIRFLFEFRTYFGNLINWFPEAARLDHWDKIEKKKKDLEQANYWKFII